MIPSLPIARALSDRNLLGAALGDLSTYTTWLSVLKATEVQPLTAQERKAFDRVAGGRQPPTKKVKEVVIIASRRSGKGRISGAVAVHVTTMIDHSAILAPGEVGVFACISPTREQSKIVQRYALGYLEASPLLREEIAEVTADEIRLRNGKIIATLAMDYRTIRGRTLLGAIFDEASFFRDETSSTPDIEAERAVLPGLATTGGTLIITSSPYRKEGLVYQRWKNSFGQNDDRVLVVAGPSIVFNPTLDEAEIAEARAADPAAALSEWDGEFRADIATFLDDELIDAAVEYGRPRELPPRAGVLYGGFADAAGGVGQDSFAFCITHREGELIIVDVIRGTSGKFDPSLVTQEYAALAREYRISTVIGDFYGAEWNVSAWRACGLNYQRSELNKSEIYLETLPLFARHMVRLPDHAQLLRELRLLERRTARSGKDIVEHPRNGRDDHANALCGAVVNAFRGTGSEWMSRITPEYLNAIAASPSRRRVHGLRPLYRPMLQPPLERQCQPASSIAASKFQTGGDV
jgi:hypothetical protein